MNIVLFGDGSLVADISKALKGLCNADITLLTKLNDFKSITKNGKPPSLICLVSDSFNLKSLISWEKVVPGTIPYLTVFNFFDKLFIGKSQFKDDEGCIECFITRWIMAKKDRAELFNIVKYLEKKPEKHPVSHLTKPLALLAANVILEQYKEGNRSCIINKEDLSYSYKKLLPVSTCTNCSPLPFDSKELTEMEFSQLLSKDIQKGYRKHDITYLKSRLEQNYLDKELGIFNVLLNDVEAPFSVAVANLPVKNNKDEVGVGRTVNYRDSKFTAILEGLERYCGLEPRGKIGNVFSCYSKLAEEKIAPERLGLHSDEQYSDPAFIFKKYDREKPYNWVWGYSLTNQKSLLVPETYAYYGTNLRDGKQNSFVYEISNGCALGGSLLEAVLYGLFEVIERDHFLITWYNRLPLPKIDISSINNKRIHMMLAKFEMQFDYEIHIFDMTLDVKVPAVWLIAKNKRDDGRMNIMCSAGCHMSYEKAIEGAIHEICGILPALNKKFDKRKDELKKMYSDFSLVKNMEDHTLLYGLKEAEAEFNFLLNSHNSIKTNRECALPYSSEPGKDLFQIINSLKEFGLEVIAVNQTAEELKHAELHCAKVIVPQMLPMTFGHKMRRVKGFERLVKVPELFNYKANNYEQLISGDVSPHPFP